MHFNFIFPAVFALGEDASLILLNVSEDFEYKDGKKTNVLKGYRYQVVSTNNYEKIIIKVPSAEPAITNAQIQSAKAKILVSFEDFMARPYRTSNGNYDLSFTASDILIEE